MVERPASVVKEFVENAIDAGAKSITVSVERGGKDLVRVTDDGEGIEEGELTSAFLPHATSKIAKAEDLESILTLGFRGEALASIASVSNVRLRSRYKSAETAFELTCSGGKIGKPVPCAMDAGTDICAENLFFNTPVREKFLKTDKGEEAEVTSVVSRFILGNPAVAFRYFIDGKLAMQSFGGGMEEALAAVYGGAAVRECYCLDAEKHGVRIRGFLGKPSYTKPNRTYQSTFVNGRFVINNTISSAIMNAYASYLMKRQYPFYVLFIDVPAEVVDVNVHPSNMELRFSSQEEIYHQLCLTIQNALLERERIPQVSLDTGKKEPDSAEKREKEERRSLKAPEPFEQRRRNLASAVPQMPGRTQMQTPPLLREEPAVYGMEEAKARRPVPAAAKSEQMRVPEAAHAPQPETKTMAENAALKPEENQTSDTVIAGEQTELFDGRLLSVQARDRHRIIGQIFDTYWLVEYRDALYIIDQHAAHEKVLFERMMREYSSRQVTSQMLCPPLVVSLTDREAELLKKHMEIFRKSGFEIEEFGGREYKLCAVPANLYQVAAGQLFVEILDGLEDFGGQTPELIQERLASMACKAAVKGNQSMSAVEAEKLIDELLTLENPYNCPHGRPTIVSMTRYEMDKKFKRIV